MGKIFVDSPSSGEVVAGRSFEKWGGYPRVQWFCRSDWTEKLVISLLSANEGGHSLAKGWAITVIHAFLPCRMLFSVFLPIQGHGSHYWPFTCMILWIPGGLILPRSCKSFRRCSHSAISTLSLQRSVRSIPPFTVITGSFTPCISTEATSADSTNQRWAVLKSKIYVSACTDVFFPLLVSNQKVQPLFT